MHDSRTDSLTLNKKYTYEGKIIRKKSYFQLNKEALLVLCVTFQKTVLSSPVIMLTRSAQMTLLSEAPIFSGLIKWSALSTIMHTGKTRQNHFPSVGKSISDSAKNQFIMKHINKNSKPSPLVTYLAMHVNSHVKQ